MNRFHFNQKGSILMLMAFTIPFLFAISAIAVDCGYLYVQRSHMQNMADAAVLAGASKLGVGTTDDAQTLAKAYIDRNSNDSDTGNTVNYDFSEENNAKKIRVDIKRPAAPLLFMKYFGFDTVELAVHAVASYTGGAKNIFDYTIISGAKKDEFTENSKNVLNLGPGGGNTYNGLIHSNYQASQGGGTNTVNGTITTVDNTVWATTSQNSFKLNGTASGNAAPIDISIENSGLTSLIDKIKSRNTYNGNYPAGADFSKFGEGIYVTGTFDQSWLSGCDTTTIIIAEGDINIGSLNGHTISANNHIIFCSLKGNISFNLSSGSFFNAIFYAPKGSINLNLGGHTLNGSVIGKTITVGYGNGKINYANYVTSGSSPDSKIRLTE